jgi:hypothetical protein
MKYYKNSLRVLSIVVLGFLLTSCAAIRGYFKDGKDGPGIYSFKHHAHDTVANGHSVFHFLLTTTKVVGLIRYISIHKANTARISRC